MALQLTLTTEYGIEVTNSYCRVEDVNIAKSGPMTFMLSRYLSQSMDYPAFARTLYSTQYDCAGENVYKQAYAHLKSLDEFKSAADVYEAGQPAA